MTLRSPWHGITDEAVLEQFLGGDERAFVELMRRYKQPIITCVYRFLGSYDDACYVSQETFVRLYRFAGTYQGEVKFSTWLYTIAGNLARTELKKYRRKYGTSLQQAFGIGEDAETWDIPDESYRPDEQVDSTKITQEVQKALMRVSPSYREMVILRDLQQLSYEEISAITETELGTVKSRINRGRAQMQDMLRELYDELFGTSSP